MCCFCIFLEVLDEYICLTIAAYILSYLILTNILSFFIIDYLNGDLDLLFLVILLDLLLLSLSSAFVRLNILSPYWLLIILLFIFLSLSLELLLFLLVLFLLYLILSPLIFYSSTYEDSDGENTLIMDYLPF